METTVTPREWTAALRSGDYKQGRGQLRDKDDCFCCLGVLADLMGADWRIEPTFGQYFIAEIDGREYINVLAHADHDGSAYPDWLLIDSGELIKDLIEMNDGGVPFEKIADHIDWRLVEASTA